MQQRIEIEYAVDNAMSKQASLSHGVFPQESESCYIVVVVLDDDIQIVNDMDTNSIQNDVTTRTSTVAAIEDDTEIDNCNIAEELPQHSMENGDESQLQQPIWMKTNPYNSYVPW